MNDIQSIYLKKLCLKYNANYKKVIDFIQIFTDMLEELSGNIPDVVVRTYTHEEYSDPSFKIFFHYVTNMSNLPINYSNSSEGFKIILNMNV